MPAVVDRPDLGEDRRIDEVVEALAEMLIAHPTVEGLRPTALPW